MKFLQADYIWALLFTHVRCIKLSILLFSPLFYKNSQKKKRKGNLQKKVGKSNSYYTFLTNWFLAKEQKIWKDDF